MNRRNFLTAFGSFPLFGAVGGHRIDSWELLRIKVNRLGNWLIIKVKTDKGLVGLGDASHGSDPKTEAALASLFQGLKGASPFDIEPYRKRSMAAALQEAGRSGQVAFSAFEQAMYDLQGKILGVPCWALFGGKLRDRVRNYANVNRASADRSPAEFAKLAAAAVKSGFDAVKMASFDGLPKSPADKRAAGTQLGIDCIAAVRKTIGPDRELLVDGHNHFTLEEALDVTRRLARYKLFWWEESVRGIENLAVVNREAPMQTAGGESLYGIEQFQPYIRGGAVDVVMPDVKYCGGMAELKKISVMAEAAGLTCAPHGPASPVGNMAAAHVCATLPNFLILELGFGETTWRGDLVSPPEVFEPGGMLTVSDRPGLGIEINERVAREHAA
ncbi:MAG: mandelate racemase/muconate lactonizing enzyme family protein [Bryobacteraceae bacterium]